MDTNRGLLKIHTAVLLFGLAGLFGKLIALPSTIIVLGRVVFAAVFLFALLLVLKVNIQLEGRKDYLLMASLGVLLAFHWVSFFTAIQLSTVAIGLLTFSTFPVFVAFIEPVMLKLRFEPISILLALLTLTGVVFIMPSFELSSAHTQGALWGISSGFSFALLSILNKKLVVKYKDLVIAFYQDLVAALVLLPALFIIRPAWSASDLSLLLVLGIVFTGVSHTLFISGLSKVKAQTASILASLEPVYGITATALILGEVPSPRTLAGGLLILLVAFYATVISKNKKSGNSRISHS